MNATPEKIRIRFTTHGSNPVVGNIWPGKQAVLNAATAKRMVSFGHAEFVDGAAPAPAAAPKEDETADENQQAASESDNEGENTEESAENEAGDETADDLESLSVKKLKELAKEENVDLQGITAKADIVAAIRARAKRNKPWRW